MSPTRCAPEVVTIGGLSAHAGQNMLVKYALNSRAGLRKTFLVHGEPEKSEALIEKLSEAGLSNVYYPGQFSEEIIYPASNPNYAR